MWYVSIAPHLEYDSDRNSFGFRPYRRSEDIFLQIKSTFSKYFIPYAILHLKFSLYLALGLNSQNWFINSFYINSTIIRTWLKRVCYVRCSKKNLEIRNVNNFIFVSALKYSLNGLVRAKKFIFIVYCNLSLC